jgi:ParB family transcriptional regulator, chromosome partitioning protein
MTFRDGWNNENPKGDNNMSREAVEVKGSEFRMVGLEFLVESKTNPRRRFEGMEELTASVEKHGVLTPLLVRSIGQIAEEYEIVAGARRYRAAKKAGAALVPIRIKEMTDEQALEFQLIENIQRKDVHPLDEALGFRQLLDLGRSAEEIGDRIGMSASHVYQRMKLAELVPAAQELFFKDQMTAGHAVQIARLTAGHQKKVLDYMKRGGVSVRELAEHISENYHLQLSRAAFPIDSADLLPAAGSCKECPKRSGANPLLFPDIKAKDTCSDSVCFHAKEAAFVKLQTETNPEAIPLTIRPGYENKPKNEPAWTRTGGKRCEDTGVGIVTLITDRYTAEESKVKLGQSFEVCINPKCKVHHPKPDREAADASYQARTGRTRSAEKASKLETKRQQAILQALLYRPAHDPSAIEVRQWLGWVLEDMSADMARLLCQAMGWEVKPDKYKQRNWHGAAVGKLRDTKDPWQLLYILAVLGQMWYYGTSDNRPTNAKHLEAAAEARGVNIAAITKQVKEAAEKKPKAAEKVEKPVKEKKATKAKTAKAKTAPKKKKAA